MSKDLATYQQQLSDKYQYLLGSTLVDDETDPVPNGSFRLKDVEGRAEGGGWVRVVTPHTRITKDLRQERINIHVGEDNKVHEFKFY